MESLAWQGPVFAISAVSGQGLNVLCHTIVDYIDACKQAEADDPELARRERDSQVRMQLEAREHIRAVRRRGRSPDEGGDDDDDGDDDVEVIYVPEG